MRERFPKRVHSPYTVASSSKNCRLSESDNILYSFWEETLVVPLIATLVVDKINATEDKQGRQKN